MQDLMEGLDPPVHPAQRPRQLDVGAQRIGGGHPSRGLLGGDHYLLHFLERAGQMRGQAVGEQGKRATGGGTVPAGKPAPRRGFAGVGAMAGEATPPSGMEGATRQASVPPGLLANVFLAGQGYFISDLHWTGDRPARLPPWRAPFMLGGRTSGRYGQYLLGDCLGDLLHHRRRAQRASRPQPLPRLQSATGFPPRYIPIAKDSSG